VKYLLFALLLDCKSGNTVMKPRFARGPQPCVRFISVISELYFVASGSVLSRMISIIFSFVSISLFLLVFIFYYFISI